MSFVYLKSSSLEEQDCKGLNLSSNLLPVEIDIQDEDLYCGRNWDNIACWPRAKAEVTLAMPCNSFKSFMDLIVSTNSRIQRDEIKGFAYLKCNSSGYWENRTDYGECTNFLNEILSDEETRKHVRHAVSIITFSLCLTSMVFLLISLGIYSFFKSLHCDRLKVHKNFMSALVIRYVVSVIYYEPYIYGEQEPFVWFKSYGRGILCKGILILLMFGYVAPVFWMFVEGIYLHSRITTNVFESKAPMKTFYFIGWFIPFISVVAWTIAMSTIEEKSCSNTVVDNFTTEIEERGCASSCWEGYDEMSYTYILSIPMTIALIVNLLFLINIVRIVVRKFRGRYDNSTISSGNSTTVRSGGGLSSGGGSSSFVIAPSHTQSDNARIRKAVRATLILFPLLGIMHLFFFVNPRNGTHDKLYMLFNASLQSSQGIVLSILYCFLASEVRETIRRHFHRVSARYEMRRETIRRNENTRRNIWSNTNLHGSSIRPKTRINQTVHTEVIKVFNEHHQVGRGAYDEDEDQNGIMQMVEIKSHSNSSIKE